LELDQTKCFKALEEEHNRLRKAISELTLDKLKSEIKNMV